MEMAEILEMEMGMAKKVEMLKPCKRARNTKKTLNLRTSEVGQMRHSKAECAVAKKKHKRLLHFSLLYFFTMCLFIFSCGPPPCDVALSVTHCARLLPLLSRAQTNPQ